MLLKLKTSCKTVKKMFGEIRVQLKPGQRKASAILKYGIRMYTAIQLTILMKK
jgi:hypothetical protein